MAGGKSNFEQECENVLIELMRGIGKIVKDFCISLGIGVKKLYKKSNRIKIYIALIVTVLARLMKVRLFSLPLPIFVCYALYVVMLCFPLIVLLFIGSGGDKEKEKYKRIFSEIGFRGKDGKYPAYQGIVVSKNSKKEVWIFHSAIPLQEWKRAKNRLESGFDRNILGMEHGKGKRVIQVTIVPNDCIIPTLVKWEDSIISDKNGVVVIGRGALKIVTFDLNRTPHVLIAGETGSGKSVILRCCLWQVINQGAKVYMFDFKGGVEFGKQYEKYGEVVTKRERALEVLDALVYENQYRLTIFRDMEVKNLPEYNKKTKQNLCRIVLICDEIGEMLDKKGISKQEKEIFEKMEGRLATLARLSRATGINLFLGVQRPDANILPGQIKNNIPIRVCGRFADNAASEIVLGNTDAVDLPDIKGRFLYRAGNEIVEFQSYLFEDEKTLCDIEVETGSMLTETPGYTADTAMMEMPKPKTAKKAKGDEKKMPLFDSAEAERIMKEMDEYDLNNLF